jgi:hypothetical protein
MGAYYIAVIASTVLAGASCFQLAARRGHPIIGALAGLVGGGLWFIVAFLAAFIFWIPFIPDRCTYDFGDIAGGRLEQACADASSRG